MDVAKRFHEAFRSVAQEHTIKEIAAALHTHYQDGRDFDQFYRHIRACFSEKKSDERFDFCDVVLIMHLFGNYEPLYAQCELLGLSRPVIADHTSVLQSTIRKVNALRSEVQEAERQMQILTELSPSTSFSAPNFEKARFCGGG